MDGEDDEGGTLQDRKEIGAIGVGDVFGKQQGMINLIARKAKRWDEMNGNGRCQRMCDTRGHDRRLWSQVQSYT
jgi:hypothetical protein